MAQEKRNPLPVGRYSLDVADFPPGHIDEWNAFVAANTAKLTVEETEEFAEDNGVPRRVFTIFHTSAPVFFPVTNFGPPTIAPKNVKSEADTETVPDANESDPFKGVERLIALGEVVLGLFTLKSVLDLVSKIRKAGS